MNEEKTKEINYTVLILSVAVFLIALVFILTSVQNTKLSQDNSILKSVMIANAEISKISVDSQLAERYYAEASYAYENENYEEVETNCRLAREYYSKEDQGYKKIKAELNEKKIDDKLIILYIEELNLLSEIKKNMFEACEHFESAARYYSLENYDMGSLEIDSMNEKIRNHDSAVEEYNNKLEEFRVELRTRLD